MLFIGRGGQCCSRSSAIMFLAPSASEEKPALSCAGFSFGDYSNELRLMAQVIVWRKNGVIQRLSEPCRTLPPLPLQRPRIEPILLVLFVATAHLSTDQMNYWNKYSDTLVRYSRYICVNRRDKYSLYSAVYQLRVCRFISR